MTVPTDADLRALDAASPTLTAAERARAEASLKVILASAPPTDTPQPAANAPVRRTRARLVLVPTAAFALLVGSVVVQGLGDGAPAYASWTSAPTPVTGDELEVVAPACRDRLRTSSIDLDRATLRLAERRGDTVALLYRTEDPDISATCLVHNPDGTTAVHHVDSGAGGSTGPALQAPATGYTQGAIMGFDGVSITDGAVGDEVTGVTIHAGTSTVEASVGNGRYVAWWPGSAFEDGPYGPSGEGGPEPILTYDLALADGTVIHDAEATLPS